MRRTRIEVGGNGMPNARDASVVWVGTNAKGMRLELYRRRSGYSDQFVHIAARLVGDAAGTRKGNAAMYRVAAAAEERITTKDPVSLASDRVGGVVVCVESDGDIWCQPRDLELMTASVEAAGFRPPSDAPRSPRYSVTGPDGKRVRVSIPDSDHRLPPVAREACTDCEGRGTRHTRSRGTVTCKSCEGSGWVR